MILPYGLGRLIVKDKEAKPWTVIVWGYVFIWALYEIFAVALILLNRSLTELTLLSGLCAFAIFVFSVVVNRDLFKNDWQRFLKFFKNLGFIKQPITFYFFAVTALLQAAYIFKYQHVDEDDADYIVLAKDALERNSLLRVNSYTGFADIPELKRIVSPFSLWIASLSKLGHVEPATMAHTILPPVFLFLAYAAVYVCIDGLIRLSSNSDGDDKGEHNKRIWFAMFIFSLLILFGGLSTRTYGAMILLRSWQGKALLCAIILPLCLATFSDLFEGISNLFKGNLILWVRLAILAFASVLLTGMSLFMVPLLFGGFLVVYGCRYIFIRIKNRG